MEQSEKKDGQLSHTELLYMYPTKRYLSIGRLKSLACEATERSRGQARPAEEQDGRRPEHHPDHVVLLGEGRKH